MPGTAVVTGASSGIGEACALAFAQQGRPLVLGARRTDRLEKVKAACLSAGSPRVVAAPLDARSLGSIERFAAVAEAEQPEVLVNNAGGALGKDPVAQVTEADLLGMIETNVIGLVRVTRALLPGLVARGKGHIVNIGSIAGRQSYEGGGVYCASKAAVRALSETLRLELYNTGVRVTQIDPGMVETEFSIVRFGDAAKAKAVYEGLEPMTAADIAECVVWSVARPARVWVQEMLVTAGGQATVYKVHRAPK